MGRMGAGVGEGMEESKGKEGKRRGEKGRVIGEKMGKLKEGEEGLERKKGVEGTQAVSKKEIELERKVRNLSRRLELMAREYGRGNVVVREMKVSEVEGRQEVEKLFREIGKGCGEMKAIGGEKNGAPNVDDGAEE